MDFVVLDFETTGLRNEDAIIEIGYVWIKDGLVKDKRSTFIHPERAISRQITQITGITNAMVKDAPKIGEVIDGFSKFLRGKIIVAHNAGFDMRFLNNALRSAKLDPINEYICTMRMFRGYKKKLRIEGGSARLADLTAYFNLTNKNAHRALADAIVTADAFMEMQKVLKWEEWITGKEKAIQKGKRALEYERLFGCGTGFEEICAQMNVKRPTVLKYFLEWVDTEKLEPYKREIRAILPPDEDLVLIGNALSTEGRISKLFDLFEKRYSFEQLQIIVKLKRLNVLDAYIKEK